MQEVAPRIYAETNYRGGNTVAFLTDEGFVLIDPPPFPDDARHWQTQLFEKDERPPRAIILSDSHRDRILGASWFKSEILIAHAATRAALSSLPGSYVNSLIHTLTTDAFEQTRFSSAHIVIPNVTFTERMRLHFGNQQLRLSHRPGPADGSVWVNFPNQDILFSGDTIVVGTPPYLNSMHSTEWMETLNIVRNQTADITIIPGRGEITGKEAIEPISEYLRIARHRVRQLYQASRPPSETVMLVHELLGFFPPPLESELEEFQQRVRTGLQCIYNEMRQNDTTVQFYSSLTPTPVDKKQDEVDTVDTVDTTTVDPEE